MPVRDYRSDLLVKLANPDFAALYLQAAVEETLQDGDQRSLLLALQDVVEARQIAEGRSTEQIDIYDQRIHERLDEAPTLETFMSLLSAAGLTIEFKPA